MTQRQPASEFRYWAFISYSHRDKTWGRWLHKALETYRVPKRLVGMPTAAGKVPSRLSPVFRDRDELPTTSDLGSAIEEALRQSRCLIVICSPEAAQSRWVNEEVLAFQRLGRGDRIHCLIVDSGNDAAAPLVFPPALGSRPDVDGGRVGEPVAADARRFGDGRSAAKLKLIAGILGIGYDTLVQREHQRRHRNLFYVTCASLALVIVLAVSTLVAITSRRDAVDQRSHAESLVEFMIGDLRKKLEPDGRLATLDAVGKEALAYYASQRSEDLDAEGLARRARALHMIGEVYDLRGELDEALKVFEQAADSTKELVEREPENGQRIFDHAQSVFWVGYIAYQRGKAAVAEPAFQEYKRLAERLVAIDPGNEDWQAELGYANSNLGTLLYDQGRPAEAEVVFEQELDAAKQASVQAPENYARQLRTAQAHAWLSSAQYRLGKFDSAISQRNSEISIYRNALSINPRNRDAQDGLAVSYRALSDTYRCQGNVNAALAAIRESEVQVTDLIQADPENTRSMDQASATLAAFAYLLNASGDRDGAMRTNSKARKFAADLLVKDSSVLMWQLRSIESQLVSAHIASRAEEHAEALEIANAALLLIEKVPVTPLRSSDRIEPLLSALRLVAEESAVLGRTAEAQDAWRRMTATVGTAEAGFFGPEARSNLVLAFRQLGDKDQSETLAAGLREIGYQEPEFMQRLRAADATETAAASRNKQDPASATASPRMD